MIARNWRWRCSTSSGATMTLGFRNRSRYQSRRCNRSSITSRWRSCLRAITASPSGAGKCFGRACTSLKPKQTRLKKHTDKEHVMKVVGHISVLNEGAANGELRLEGSNETTTVYTQDLVAAKIPTKVGTRLLFRIGVRPPGGDTAAIDLERLG